MENTNINSFMLRTALGIIVVSVVWQVMEKLFYGEVQPRVVDNIIAVIWIVSVYAAYFVGRKHQQEENQSEEP